MLHDHFKRLRAIVPVLCCSFSIICCGQPAGKTHWVLADIKRADGQPMHGFTLAYMEEAAALNPYFIKEGPRLLFDYPSQRATRLDSFRSLTGQRFGNEERFGELRHALMDSITKVEESGGRLTVNFVYRATLNDDQQFVAVYKTVPADEYQRMLVKDRAAQAEEKAAVDSFVTAYAALQPGPNSGAAAVTRPALLEGSSGKATLLLPEGYTAAPWGNIFVHHFGALEVGTHAENDMYALTHEAVDGEVLCFVLPAEGPAVDMQSFIDQEGLRVISKSSDGFFAIGPAYDADTKKVSAERFVHFRYFTKQGVRVLVLADTDDEAVARQHAALYRQISRQ